MNPLKAEVRKLTAQDMGKAVAEKRAAAENAQVRQIGAKDALQAAAKLVGEHVAKVRNAWRENGVIEGFEPEEVAKLNEETQKKIIQGQIRWVQRTIGTLDSLVSEADRAIIGNGAKVKAFKDAEDAAKAIYQEEVAKLEAFERGVEAGLITKDDDGNYVMSEVESDGETNSVVGVHPGLTLKAQRQREEAEEQKGGDGPEDAPQEPEAPQEPKEEAPKKKEDKPPAKPKRLRPKKDTKAKRTGSAGKRKRKRE